MRMSVITRTSLISEDTFGVIGYLRVLEEGLLDYILFDLNGKISHSTKSICQTLFSACSLPAVGDSQNSDHQTKLELGKQLYSEKE